MCACWTRTSSARFAYCLFDVRCVCIKHIPTALRASDNEDVSRSLPMSRTDSPVPHQCSTDRAAGARSPDGNCAQCSNENTGLRAIVSNIERKKFALNVRHHFHCPASFHATGHFAKEKR